MQGGLSQEPVWPTALYSHVGPGMLWGPLHDGWEWLSLSPAFSCVNTHSQQHVLVMCATAFYLIENYPLDVGPEFSASIIQMCGVMLSGSEESTPSIIYHCALRGLERLLLSEQLSRLDAESLVKLSVDRVNVHSPHRAMAALGLMLTCMYTGEPMGPQEGARGACKQCEEQQQENEGEMNTSESQVVDGFASLPPPHVHLRLELALLACSGNGLGAFRVFSQGQGPLTCSQTCPGHLADLGPCCTALPVIPIEVAIGEPFGFLFKSILKCTSLHPLTR
ncbi:hypothetical protein P7K49_005937 [Saguinus oedipus]|uniref:Uncharacterized protein n=1 Tax=Saguinus oedipus TaxID=9490 RepID=A0ABQ9W1S1_SAGOE|nr:hypothetical protein P7K49_005937 [Saguinus oedipus]